MTHLYMMEDYVILTCNFDKRRLSIGRCNLCFPTQLAAAFYASAVEGLVHGTSMGCH